MPVQLDYLEGRKICVVFCQLKDEETFKKSEKEPEEAGFRLKCLHGLGNIIDGKYLKVEGDQGSFQIPPSAYKNIYPNDGTDILKDSEYFVMVKLDSKLEF
ncbi:MAG: hypothetical protein NE334_20670 [Lentisphaeraceae bacterium]|nr:hypothetical protein [Lentisphaeraceae bacterium]